MKRLLEDTRGGLLVFVAFATAVFVGVAAVAMDYGFLMTMRVRLQTSADASALAAAQDIGSGAPIDVAVTYAGKNMDSTYHGAVLKTGDAQLGNWDGGSRTFTDGGTPENAIRVTLRRSESNGNPVSLFLAQFLGFDKSDVIAAAIAVRIPKGPCMLALDPTKELALKLNSKAEIHASDCNIQVNSSHDDAVEVSSESIVEILGDGEVCIVGGVKPGDGTIDPSPNTDCDVFPDPYAGMPEPLASPCDHDDEVQITSGTHTLEPGVYCKGLVVNGNSVANLNPGVYVITGGKLVVNDATLQGNGVTIFLHGALAQLDINSKAIVDLKGPSSGTYAGMVIFQQDGINIEHTINSDSNVQIKGTMYFPDSKVTFNSSEAGTSQICGSIVAREFELNSDVQIELKFPGDCGVSLGGGGIRLVS